MDVNNYDICYHCLSDGHWVRDCPLLVPPENRAEHWRRLDEIRDRFLYGNLPPGDRARMICTENALWQERQKQAAAKSA